MHVRLLFRICKSANDSSVVEINKCLARTIIRTNEFPVKFLRLKNVLGSVLSEQGREDKLSFQHDRRRLNTCYRIDSINSDYDTISSIVADNGVAEYYIAGQTIQIDYQMR